MGERIGALLSCRIGNGKIQRRDVQDAGKIRIDFFKAVPVNLRVRDCAVLLRCLHAGEDLLCICCILSGTLSAGENPCTIDTRRNQRENQDQKQDGNALSLFASARCLLFFPRLFSLLFFFLLRVSINIPGIRIPDPVKEDLLLRVSRRILLCGAKKVVVSDVLFGDLDVKVILFCPSPWTAPSIFCLSSRLPHASSQPVFLHHSTAARESEDLQSPDCPGLRVRSAFCPVREGDTLHPDQAAIIMLCNRWQNKGVQR